MFKLNSIARDPTVGSNLFPGRKEGGRKIEGRDVYLKLIISFISN
jgi:hypothetical protein